MMFFYKYIKTHPKIETICNAFYNCKKWHAARSSFWKPPGCEASRERLLHSALTRSEIAAALATSLWAEAVPLNMQFLDGDAGELGKVSVPPLLLSFHTPFPLFLLISIAIFPSDLALKAAVPRRYRAVP